MSAATGESLIDAAVSPNPYMLDSATLPMPLVREFPDQPLPCRDACPQAMILLPVLARLDQALGVLVNAGERVRALARRGKA